MGTTASPKIELYTSRVCPWAHRAHIALAELDLPFTEHTIDLDTPRTAEYLKINPRGLVPTIVYNGEIIPESAIVSWFLADAHPSHLVKTSIEPGGALERARINFFVDAFISKVVGPLFAGVRATDETAREEAEEKLVAAIEKELEPLLVDAAPFFGGSSKLTLAEVLTGSFVVRLLDFPEYGLLPSSLPRFLINRAPNFSKWADAVAAHKSVNDIWKPKEVAERTLKKLNAAKV